MHEVFNNSLLPSRRRCHCEHQECKVSCLFINLCLMWIMVVLNFDLLLFRKSPGVIIEVLKVCTFLSQFSLIIVSLITDPLLAIIIIITTSIASHYYYHHHQRLSPSITTTTIITSIHYHHNYHHHHQNSPSPPPPSVFSTTIIT